MEDYSIFRLYYTKLRSMEPLLPILSKADKTLLQSIESSLGYSSFRLAVSMSRLFKVTGKETGFTKFINRIFK